MSNYLLKTLLISATALMAVNAEKMDFSYSLDASQTVCFLEHLAEGVQCKPLISHDCIINTCFYSHHRSQFQRTGTRPSAYNHWSKRQKTWNIRLRRDSETPLHSVELWKLSVLHSELGQEEDNWVPVHYSDWRASNWLFKYRDQEALQTSWASGTKGSGHDWTN